jgi:hypothetical protein
MFPALVACCQLYLTHRVLATGLLLARPVRTLDACVTVVGWLELVGRQEGTLLSLKMPGAWWLPSAASW